MSVDQAKPRFRWRIIPAGLLLGMGVLMLLGGTLSFIAILVLLYQAGPVPPGGSYRMLAGLGLMQAGALFLIATGRLILLSRWKWMLLTLVIAYAACAAGLSLIDSAQRILGPSRESGATQTTAAGGSVCRMVRPTKHCKL